MQCRAHMTHSTVMHTCVCAGQYLTRRKPLISLIMPMVGPKIIHEYISDVVICNCTCNLLADEMGFCGPATRSSASESGGRSVRRGVCCSARSGTVAVGSISRSLYEKPGGNKKDQYIVEMCMHCIYAW